MSSLLAVLGPTPKPLRGPTRAARWADLSRLAGDLAETPYLAGYAACHALMGGVERVVLGPVVGDDWTAALGDLLAAHEPAVVIAPGIEPESASALAAGFGDLTEIWLDGLADVTCEGALARQAELGDRARLLLPSVRASTPGRPRQEGLPATAVAGSLLVGAATRLRGTVEVTRRFEDSELDELVAARCGVLLPRGKRGQVALVASRAPAAPPARTPDETVPGLSALLEARLGGLAFGQRPGPALWRRVERETRALLEGLTGRGGPSGRTYLVRCDAETNDGAGHDVVVEILVRDAARVEKVVFRVGQM